MGNPAGSLALSRTTFFAPNFLLREKLHVIQDSCHLGILNLGVASSIVITIFINIASLSDRFSHFSSLALRVSSLRTRAYPILGSISAATTPCKPEPTMAGETNATSSPTPPATSTLDRNSPNEAIDEKAGEMTLEENTAAEGARGHHTKERK